MKTNAVLLIIILCLFISCQKDEKIFSFAGIVIDSETLNPVEDATIAVRSMPYVPGGGYQVYCAEFSFRTPEDGRFSFSRKCNAGDYDYIWIFMVAKEGYFIDLNHEEWSYQEFFSSNENIIFKLNPIDFSRLFILSIKYTHGESNNYDMVFNFQEPDEEYPTFLNSMDYPRYYSYILIDREYTFHVKGREFNNETQTMMETSRLDTILNFSRNDPDTLKYKLEFDNVKDTLMFTKYNGD